MVVTREMDYAVRIIRVIYQKGALPASVIADWGQIPQSITHKILRKLLQAGIISSNRGAVGGYALVNSCDQLTLYDIFRAVDDRPFLNRCQKSDYPCEWEADANDSCGIRRELCRIQAALELELRRKSLSEVFADPLDAF